MNKKAFSKKSLIISSIITIIIVVSIAMVTGTFNNNNNSNITKKKLSFPSDGLTLVGNMYYPPNYQATTPYPTIVVSGSWTTVKEQMAGTYAEGLASNGFITFAFDFRNFGESEGEPRFHESPNLKSKDIKNAIDFLASQPEVDAEKIGVFGVCAGAMYSLMAAAETPQVKAIVTAASWLHDGEAVKLFYGGAEGVAAKIKAAQEAKDLYRETKEVAYIPAISETDETAAMFGPFDYYLNPERGNIKEWSHDKFAVASWEDWLTSRPMETAAKLRAPLLMIHSDGAVLPEYTKKYFADLTLPEADKKLHWMQSDLEPPFDQFNFYDQATQVNETIDEATKWFTQKLDT
ncbi:hypothetical protein COTS27_01359 [Spirochaetota bacterium]|nr:hypothetical protein COTS27_01359 [Spirochaetota bacterium]